jgi:hypothetical protein
MDICATCELNGIDCPTCAYRNLADATRLIAHGNNSGPTGLEAVAMALSGSGSGTNVADALMEIANAINRLAEAVSDRG